MTKFQPTDTMVHSAEILLQAIAKVERLKPIVLGYKRAILENGQWSVRSDQAASLGDEWVLDPLDAYRLSDEDRAVFEAQCNAARDEAGLEAAPPDQCPLLAAEQAVVMAKHAMIDAMFVHEKKTVEALLLLGIDEYEQYVEECLQLLAPFVKNVHGSFGESQEARPLAAAYSTATTASQANTQKDAGFDTHKHTV